MTDQTPDELLIQLAWDTLPARHRQLLEQIGAAHVEVVTRPLGDVCAELLISAGEREPSPEETRASNRAIGIWQPTLNLVLINAAHPALDGVAPDTREHLLTWVVWHEWGHALSVSSMPTHDRREGERLLDIAPVGIRNRIRSPRYGRAEYIHEIIAETYALLMRERIAGRQGKPQWLADEIYDLTMRIGA